MVIDVNEQIIVIVFTTLVSLIGPALVFIVAWIKIRPETRKIDAEGQATSADAIETALRSTELAIKQMSALQTDLYDERSKRRNLENELNTVKADLTNLTARVGRLEGQIRSMGMEPVK